MNYIDFKQGGHPEVLNDFDFLLSALKEGVEGLSTLLGYNAQKVVILSGVNVVDAGGGVYNWSDGFIWIDGELLKVDAGTITLSTGTLEWDFVETVDTTGTVLYENGNTEDTYIIRRATLTEVTPAGPYAHSGALTFSELVLKIVSDGELTLPAWVSATYQNTWATGFSAAARFRKDQLKRVTLSGIVANSTYNTSKTSIFVLPVGYRPTRRTLFTAPLAQAAGGSIPVAIQTNGQVEIFDNVNSYGGNIAIAIDFSFPLD